MVVKLELDPKTIATMLDRLGIAYESITKDEVYPVSWVTVSDLEQDDLTQVLDHLYLLEHFSRLPA